MLTSSIPSPSSSRQTKISAWLPISAFIGTSLALVIPLFMLHRKRTGKNPFRISLKNSQAPPPPPRRSNTTTLTPLRGTITPPSSTSKQGLGTTSELSDASSSPRMMSAISQMNQSTALLAAKAFLIATGLVAVGGVMFIWGVKTTLGVEDAREFGQKMRSVLQTTVPGLRSRLYRPPETDDERYEIEPRGVAIDQEWKWEEAEKRLKKAYEEGGIGVWAQTAFTELEAETRVQRIKRNGEQEASTSDKEEPSLD